MFLLLAMVIIGGRQSLVGCVVGAVGLSLLREALIDYPTYAQIAYGSVVVLVVVFAPTGLAGLPARGHGRTSRRRLGAGRRSRRTAEPSARTNVWTVQRETGRCSRSTRSASASAACRRCARCP